MAKDKSAVALGKKRWAGKSRKEINAGMAPAREGRKNMDPAKLSRLMAAMAKKRWKKRTGDKILSHTP